jgi:predicted kinase
VRAADARSGVADRPEDADARAARSDPVSDRRLEDLPDSHPSSPRYADSAAGRTADPADRIRPLTDAEHAEHVAEVRTRLADSRARGLETNERYTIDAAGEIWSPERTELHNEIVAHLYSQASDAPCDRQAILAGGLPGAGKSTILTGHAGIELSRYLMVNPDLIKVEMARRGLIPEVDGLSPMEASDLVHEECSHIARRLAHRAQADGKNMIWDITMASSETTNDRISELRRSGYGSVSGIFVDIPIEVSVRRAEARHRGEHEQFRAGSGYGGRYIPPEVIEAKADSEWGSLNHRTFERVKYRLDSWSEYDNSVDGASPVLISSGRGRDWEDRP